MVLKTFGGAKQLIDCNGGPVQPIGPDLSLQKAIARGRRWAQQLETGERCGSDDIAATEDLQSRYVDKVMRLAWLALHRRIDAKGQSSTEGGVTSGPDRVPLESTGYVQLKRLLSERMSMSHVYQPLLIRTIRAGGGAATRRQIASAFLAADLS